MNTTTAKAARLPSQGAVPIGLLSDLDSQIEGIDRQLDELLQRKAELKSLKTTTVLETLIERFQSVMDIDLTVANVQGLTQGEWRSFGTQIIGFDCYYNGSLQGNPLGDRLLSTESLDNWRTAQLLLETTEQLKLELSEQKYVEVRLDTLIASLKYCQYLQEEDISCDGTQVTDLFLEKLRVLCINANGGTLTLPDGTPTMEDVYAVLEGRSAGAWSDLMVHIIGKKWRKVVLFIDALLLDEGEGDPANQAESIRVLMDLRQRLERL